MTSNQNIVSEWSGFRGRGSLLDVVNELKRQTESRKDFVVDSRDLKVVPDLDAAPGTLRLVAATDSVRDFLPREGHRLLPQALVQFAGKAGPGLGARELKKLAAANPNRTAEFLTGLAHDDPHRRLVRCLDDHVRAFLSDRYRVIDNLDLATWALQGLKDVGGQVLEASVTDRHLRIKMVSTEVWDRVERERTGGDSRQWYAGGLGNQQFLSRVSARSVEQLPLQGGQDTVWPIVNVTNSETGHGGYGASVGILQGICFNLATVEDRLVNVHLGSRLETGILSTETVQAEARAIMLKLRDTIQSGFDQDAFRRLVDTIRDAAAREIHSPSQATDLLVKASDALVDDDIDNLLGHFRAEPGVPSVYSLGQAVSRYAQDTDDADKADGLEALAGAVLRGDHNKALAKVTV